MNERPEPWLDKPPYPIIPIREPYKDLIKLECGQFTRFQREWFLKRDTDPETGLVRCQFQGFTPNNDWVQCPMDEQMAGGTRHLHAHHILAAGFFQRWFAKLSDDPHEQTENFPENGIILCEQYHHMGEKGIHPDYSQARKNYGYNQNSFNEVAQRHHQSSEQGVPYWNTKYDRILWQIASERTQEYLSNHPEDEFPYK